MLQDPYEKKHLELGISSVAGGGDGVFLTRDVARDKVAAYYSLHLYKHDDQLDLFKETCSHNTSRNEEYRRECNKYSIDLNTYLATISLPPELDKDPLPTFGPKVNHHFRANNSVYTETEHPIWGLIVGVMPQVDLQAGQELFTYYNYERTFGVPEDFPEDFPWYWETKLKVERNDRLAKEMNE